MTGNAFVTCTGVNFLCFNLFILPQYVILRLCNDALSAEEFVGSLRTNAVLKFSWL
jgi:hypothetical protein